MDSILKQYRNFISEGIEKNQYESIGDVPKFDEWIKQNNPSVSDNLQIGPDGTLYSGEENNNTEN